MTKGKLIAVLVVIIIIILGIYSACDHDNGYSLYNKDGTFNYKYYNDMQDYFNKHPEKRP